MATLSRPIVDSHWQESATAELRAGLGSVRMWAMLAHFDVVSRYRRTAIGPFWQTLTLAIFVGSLGFVYSALFNMEVSTYVPFLTASLLPWLFISTIINEGCTVFVEGEPIIKNTRVPLSMFAFRVTLRNFIVLLHNLPVLVLVLLILGSPVGWPVLLAPLGLVLILINAPWVVLVLGLLTTRFRDIQQLVAILLQVTFLVTPIMWSPALLGGGRAFIAELNPLHHFLEVFRAPVLGAVPAALSYGVVLITTLVGWTGALALFRRYRSRVAYWL
jgi:lipopolysaccharide transport system permease protein